LAETEPTTNSFWWPEQLDLKPLRQNAAEFEAAFAAYQKQAWDAAEAALRALNARAPRALYDIYLERIAHFRAEPPPTDWDGVCVYTTK